MQETFQDVEAARRRAGMTVNAMCHAAGVGAHLYYRARSGRTVPTPKTLERWRRALVGGPAAKRLSGAPVNSTLLRATYRGYVAALAPEMGTAAPEVLASDPGLRANSDPAWALAARVRALAVYCVVVEFDMPAARVAAAIGITRAAASAILKRVEDLRDEAGVDALVDRVGKLISGRAD